MLYTRLSCRLGRDLSSSFDMYIFIAVENIKDHLTVDPVEVCVVIRIENRNISEDIRKISWKVKIELLVELNHTFRS
ncbi:hypothetical protein WICPIJ_001715 [Wickerhamomyces pijperi]|uniref:Uncharacterized protein n=1 Tax=Wickerhamomyces pijperi TaxID=599730 RepID=A0A9P8QB23_WICPI|nr:hypothetical protein WICPIJ_001715 [Wickerhamomyces pijperi]